MKAILKASTAGVGHNSAALSGTFGGAIMSLAGMPTKLSTGAIGIAHKYSNELELVRTKLMTARRKDNDETVRDTCLSFFRTFPEGIALDTEKKAIGAIDTAARTDVQRTRWANIKTLENNIALQIERACDVYTGMMVLRTTRDVFIDEIGTDSGVFACYVRSEKHLKERDNVPFGSGALQAVAANVKYITADTKTADVLARVLGKVGKGRKGKAGASKGGNVAALGASELPPVLKQIDNTIAALTKDDGVGFTSGPEARRGAFMLWARLDALMTAKEKDEARASFAAEGIAEKRKASAAKGKRTKLVKALEATLPSVPVAKSA